MSSPNMMKTCTLLLLVTLVQAIHDIKDGEFVKITNAIVFKPLESDFVYYTSSFPILYKEKFHINEEEIREYVKMSLSRKCTQYDREKCELVESEWMEFCKKSNVVKKSCAFANLELEKCQKCNPDLDANVTGKTKQVLEAEMEAALFDLRQDLSSKNWTGIKKRGPTFSGEYFSFCCGTALEEQLVPAEENNDRLSTHYSRLEQAVIENHRKLFSFEKAVNGLGRKITHGLEEIKWKIKQQNVTTDLKEGIAIQLGLLLQYYKDIIEYCHSSLIPVNFVKPAALKKDLALLQAELQKYGKTLAIDADKINEYYKLRIVSCQQLNDEISVLLKVPIKQMNTIYLLFEVVSVPFSFGEEVCQLRTQKSLVLHEREKDEVRILTSQAMEKCNGVDKLCAIVPTIEDENSVCLKKIYRGESTDEIKRSCNFECRSTLASQSDSEDEVRPIINKIAYREYVITRLTNKIFVQYENRTKIRLQWSGDNTGAFYLQLGCTNKLIQQLNHRETILIDSEVPCFSEGATEGNVKITRILPAAWCRIPDSVIEDSFKTRNEHLMTTKLINTLWKQEIPIVRMLTDLKLESKMDTLILEQMDHVAQENQKFTKMWLIISTIALIAFVSLASCVIGMHRQLTMLKKAIHEPMELRQYTRKEDEDSGGGCNQQHKICKKLSEKIGCSGNSNVSNLNSELVNCEYIGEERELQQENNRMEKLPNSVQSLNPVNVGCVDNRELNYDGESRRASAQSLTSWYPILVQSRCDADDEDLLQKNYDYDWDSRRASPQSLFSWNPILIQCKGEADGEELLPKNYDYEWVSGRGSAMSLMSWNPILVQSEGDAGDEELLQKNYDHDRDSRHASTQSLLSWRPILVQSQDDAGDEELLQKNDDYEWDSRRSSAQSLISRNPVLVDCDSNVENADL